MLGLLTFAWRCADVCLRCCVARYAVAVRCWLVDVRWRPLREESRYRLRARKDQVWKVRLAYHDGCHVRPECWDSGLPLLRLLMSGRCHEIKLWVLELVVYEFLCSLLTCLSSRHAALRAGQ